MDLITRNEERLMEDTQQQHLQCLTASSVGELMRAQDADLLESHHALSVNQNTVVDNDEDDVEDEDFPRGEDGETSNDIHVVASSHHPKESWLAVMSHSSPSIPEVENENADDSSPTFIRRPKLSGQIFLTETQEGISSDDYQTSLDNGTGTSLLLKDDIRERRISEAAQFAAAVGDISASEDIQIIEDHDDDDDDSEALEEVNNDTRSINSATALSLGEASLHSFKSAKAVVHMERSVASLPTFSTPPPPITPRINKLIFTKQGFLDKLPGKQEGDQSTFVYKGIISNPPEIVSHGIQRGNYAQLHRKAWLEVSDKYHRYGKNLRLYYRHWEKLGCPFHMFFDWLDSKGEAAGQPLPELDDCPRAQLDSDVVLYITNPDTTEHYSVSVLVHTESGRGIMVDSEGHPIVTGDDGWIFVLRDNRFYGGQKITSTVGERSKQRFHHSSFFGGKAVEAAGIFKTDQEGFLTQLLPHSGHYRPGEAHMQRVLFFLYHMGVDLRTFDMDMQQILHVARDEKGDDGKIEKKKKMESLCLQPAVLAACFLAHKARFIGNGIFSQIHRIKNASVTTVSEALELIDPATAMTASKET
jgi:hypothetical protein